MSVAPAGRWMLLLAASLCGCASGPPPPDWQANATSAAEEAQVAHLLGDTAREERAMARARAELARTGRPELLARLALMRCAARVASLEFGPCAAFEPLRQDAAPAEQAYADYLAGRPLAAPQAALLPQAQQAPAAALARPAAGSPPLSQIEDPLSRLVAVATLFQAGKADPTAIALAADTASAQGWRRPLLAWLQVLAARAEQAGATQEAARLRRRIELVTPPR